MKKEQKRLIILLIILLCAVTYWLYDRQKGFYKVPKMPEVAVKPIEMPIKPFTTPQQVPVVEPPPVLEVKVERAWGRDPFELPVGVEIVKKVSETEQKTIKEKEKRLPKVTCIFIKGLQKVATIDGKNCCEGDVMEDEKVVEILPDRVILEKGRERKEILLEGGNIPIVKKVK